MFNQNVAAGSLGGPLYVSDPLTPQPQNGLIGDLCRANGSAVRLPQNSLIGDLCRANGSAVRLYDALQHLAYKLGLGGAGGVGEQTGKPTTTPSITELAGALAARLEMIEKGLAEIHQTIGER